MNTRLHCINSSRPLRERRTLIALYHAIDFLLYKGRDWQVLFRKNLGHATLTIENRITVEVIPLSVRESYRFIIRDTTTLKGREDIYCIGHMSCKQNVPKHVKITCVRNRYGRAGGTYCGEVSHQRQTLWENTFGLSI